jgi:outer membrane protein TolC
MTRWLLWVTVVAGLAGPVPVGAQVRLTVDEAVARAAAGNPDARVSAVAEREAAARLARARAGFWPTVDVSETWQRGNQPVFVFSSLLARRQFAESDFAVDTLNRPDPLDNFRTTLSAEASIFDPALRPAVRAAALGVDVAGVEREAVERELAASVVAAYGAVVSAVTTRRAVAAGLETANADLALAERRRDVGLATDADVLQMALHLAATREREIRATADEVVARARLNQLMGVGLDEVFVLDENADPGGSETSAIAALEAAAVATRAEVRLAALHESLAETALASARAQFLPKVSAMAGWEANGGQWDARASGWMAGAVARMNLFSGFADRARVAEAREARARRRIERERIETSVRVDVRVAQTRLEAARATADVAQAAVRQAAESHRIVRDRYDAGLADVTALLRAAEGMQAADARLVAARVDVLVAVAAWRRATGK